MTGTIDEKAPKASRYLAAGSPLSCFLPSCRKLFIGTCIHGKDGHFYCCVRNPVQRGHRFHRKADSNPVIADSR